MLEDQAVRDKLLKRMSSAGWIEEAKIIQSSPESVSYSIKYTPHGLVRIKALADIFEELGLTGAHLMGESEALLCLARRAAPEV